MPLIQKRFIYYTNGSSWSRSVLWALVAIPVILGILLIFIRLQRRRKAQAQFQSQQQNNQYYQTQQTGGYQAGQPGGVYQTQPTGQYSAPSGPPPPNANYGPSYPTGGNPTDEYAYNGDLPAYSPPPGPPPAKMST